MTDASGLDRETLVDKLTLANVYCVGFEGELESSDSAESFTVSLEPSYRVLPGTFDYLFEATCEPRSKAGERVAIVRASIVASFDVAPAVDTSAVPSELVDWVGANIATYAAYPYVREALQGLAARLGIPNLTMDLVKRGEPLPEGLSIGPPLRSPE